jgi:hypothetical protein
MPDVTNMPEPVQAVVHSVRRSVPNFVMSNPSSAMKAMRVCGVEK